MYRWPSQSRSIGSSVRSDRSLSHSFPSITRPSTEERIGKGNDVTADHPPVHSLLLFALSCSLTPSGGKLPGGEHYRFSLSMPSAASASPSRLPGDAMTGLQSSPAALKLTDRRSPFPPPTRPPLDDGPRSAPSAFGGSPKRKAPSSLLLSSSDLRTDVEPRSRCDDINSVLLRRRNERGVLLFAM